MMGDARVSTNRKIGIRGRITGGRMVEIMIGDGLSSAGTAIERGWRIVLTTERSGG